MDTFRSVEKWRMLSGLLEIWRPLFRSKTSKGTKPMHPLSIGASPI
jgi:hypothetical protein